MAQIQYGVTPGNSVSTVHGTTTLDVNGQEVEFIITNFNNESAKLRVTPDHDNVISVTETKGAESKHTGQTHRIPVEDGEIHISPDTVLRFRVMVVRRDSTSGNNTVTFTIMPLHTDAGLAGNFFHIDTVAHLGASSL